MRARANPPTEPGGRKTVYALILKATALPRCTRENIYGLQNECVHSNFGIDNWTTGGIKAVRVVKFRSGRVLCLVQCKLPAIGPPICIKLILQFKFFKERLGKPTTFSLNNEINAKGLISF